MLGERCRVRARSRLEGDLPSYGLAGGRPAVLENYICPRCHTNLKSLRRIGEVFEFGCPACGETQVRIPILRADWPQLSHVLLPAGQIGPKVALDGYDPSWQDMQEMRLRG